MEYVKAMRPLGGVFNSLLCLAAFRLQAPTFVQEYPWQIALLLISVFCGTSATMVWNDFTDRHHDVKKGKYHAQNHPGTYATLAWCLWCSCIGCSIWAVHTAKIEWLLIGILILCVVGIFYPSTYPVPGLAMGLVGVASASSTLFPLFVPQPQAIGQGVALFIGVMLTISAREILKDLEDIRIDPGFKITIPVVCGAERARWIAGAILLLGALILLPPSNSTLLIIMPLCMVTSSIVVLTAKTPEKVGKVWIDATMVVFLLALLFFL